VRDRQNRTDLNLPEPTEARFRIRSLFVAMAVVAVATAAVGPLVRQLPATAQSWLLVAWAVWLAAAIASLGILARKRQEAEKLAGPALLQVPCFHENDPFASPQRRRFKIIGSGLAAIFMMLLFSTAIIHQASGLPWIQDAFLTGLFGVGSLVWAVSIVVNFWWRKAVRFCERGILWDRKYLRWDHVVDAEWYAHDSALSKVSLQIKGIDQQNVDTTLNIGVPPDQHEVIQVILDLHVVQRPAVEFKQPAGELGTIPLSAAVRDPRFPRYVASIILTIVIALAVSHFFTARVTGNSEFDQSVFLGVFVGAFVISWYWRRSGTKAGAPLVRLSGRRSWWEFSVFAALAAVLYTIGSKLGWYSSTVSYTTGIGAGTMASMTFATIFWRQLDLRENGVCAQGHYWPWCQVRIMKQHTPSIGRLVLARGWRRIVAVVPPEQREAVEAVLRDKLND
jgi:hypothetical protein